MTPPRSAVMAMLGAAAVTAQCVAGKATRDALFLTSLDFTALPAMLVAASVWSILLLTAHARVARTVPPTRLMPLALGVSGIVFVAEWAVRAAAPAPTAVVVYLHVTGSTSLLASTFWLIVSERFDPRTAKRRIGHIAGAGTVGGLAGALLAERIAAMAGVPTMLLFLAGFQFITAGLIRILALSDAANRGSAPGAGFTPDPARAPRRSALRVVADAPHLRHAAALVLLGTTSAALLEYLFKTKAVEAFGAGDQLLRFFAAYYAGAGLVTFVLQTGTSRLVLERFGLGLTSSTPSIALIAGSLVSLVAPGLGSLLVARGGEAIFRGSWFRAGYELFYTPVPTHEKRAAKSVIDVGFDRLGDAVAGGVIRLVLAIAPAAQSSTILSLAMISAAAAIVVASRLNHWYLQTLETSLITRGGDFAVSRRADDSLRQRLGRIARNASRLRLGAEATTTRSPHAETRATTLWPLDADLRDALALRAGRPKRAIAVLSREGGLQPRVLHDVIPLLADESLAEHAMLALSRVAEEHVGALGDVLLDSRTAPAIRLRLARVFAVCVSQRAADVLFAALDDERFDVRFQAARSLAAIRDKNPRVRLDRERVHEVVLREVGSLDPVREGHDESLAHVFTLLSLVMPREPLRIAYRSLGSADRRLRGTALEYLEGVLPRHIRERLWPLLDAPRTRLSPLAPDDALTGRLTSAR